MAIKNETLSISHGNASFHGYFAAPDQDSAPGVLVIQEIFGVNSHIRSVCDRFAEAGFAALAPDVFWSVQPDIELGYNEADIAKGRELKAAMNTDEVVADLTATFNTLAERPECIDHDVAVVGFCYGGFLAYLAATRFEPACVSSYYGGGIVDYLNEVDHISCPMQFHFGAQDTAIPMEHVESIRSALAAKTDIEVFVYPQAGHGFHCDQRGSYNQASAAQAWQRTLALFSANLR